MFDDGMIDWSMMQFVGILGFGKEVFERKS